MPDFRRLYVPGGTIFFTLVTEGRVRLFDSEAARALLGDLLRACRERWPFRVEAAVLLPEHVHMLWSLPEGDSNYSVRWAWVKKEFTKRWLAGGGREQARSESRIKNRRRGVLQRRFWDHVVRDETDFEHHFDYIHYNPVRHGHVTRPRDWPHSSFHRYVRAGWYPIDWGCGPDMSHTDCASSILGEPDVS